MQLTAWAERAAGDHLRAALPRRWNHVRGVSARAKALCRFLPVDADLLLAAAWLHDVGYAPALASTGFHPLDGARYLLTTDAPRRLVDLVAMHSSAAAEAEAKGLSAELAEFADERSLTRDLLWYADMTTGPDGQSMSFEERMADVRARYDAGHYVIRALDAGMAERRAAVERARAWLVSVDGAGQV